jgi:hypothetical protein
MTDEEITKEYEESVKRVLIGLRDEALAEKPVPSQTEDIQARIEALKQKLEHGNGN